MTYQPYVDYEDIDASTGDPLLDAARTASLLLLDIKLIQGAAIHGLEPADGIARYAAGRIGSDVVRVRRFVDTPKVYDRFHQVANEPVSFGDRLYRSYFEATYFFGALFQRLVFSEAMKTKLPDLFTTLPKGRLDDAFPDVESELIEKNWQDIVQRIADTEYYRADAIELEICLEKEYQRAVSTDDNPKDWIGPYPSGEWAKAYGVEVRTFQRRIKDGKIRFRRMPTGEFKIHHDHAPD